MYNQHVTWNSTNTLWEYSPLKYWPNDFADNDVDAQTPAAQGSTTYGGKVSFFAYAPYVATASGTSGITAISANNVGGNPTITYKMASTGKNVLGIFLIHMPVLIIFGGWLFRIASGLRYLYAFVISLTVSWCITVALTYPVLWLLNKALYQFTRLLKKAMSFFNMGM